MKGNGNESEWKQIHENGRCSNSETAAGFDVIKNIWLKTENFNWVRKKEERKWKREREREENWRREKDDERRKMRGNFSGMVLRLNVNRGRRKKATKIVFLSNYHLEKFQLLSLCFFFLFFLPFSFSHFSFATLNPQIVTDSQRSDQFPEMRKGERREKKMRERKLERKKWKRKREEKEKDGGKENLKEWFFDTFDDNILSPISLIKYGRRENLWGYHLYSDSMTHVFFAPLSFFLHFLSPLPSFLFFWYCNTICIKWWREEGKSGFCGRKEDAIKWRGEKKNFTFFSCFYTDRQIIFLSFSFQLFQVHSPLILLFLFFHERKREMEGE